jgi:3-dehydroquinate synthase
VIYEKLVIHPQLCYILNIMKKIKVNLGERSYDILIGSGAVDRLPGIIRSMRFSGPVVVITDKNVAKKTGRITAPVLKKLSNDILEIVVPASERSKSLEVFRRTAEKVSKGTRKHRPLIIAVGGGVVGDLAGFVASTYRRGVPFIQVPTTLLAQVDSSVGGKVGIDLPHAKNLIGSFYQPNAVLMDPRFLKTLPARQVLSGLAEVIKYGIIANPKFFDFLEKNIAGIRSLDMKKLEKVIFECAAIKARVVEKDEFDLKDIRIALNFGHTLGHAIESASGYSDRYNHGESIAVGMILAGEIAKQLDMFTGGELDRMKSLMKKAGLPAKIEGVQAAKILASHKYDKKFTGGANRFVLPGRIGKVFVVEDVPGALIRDTLREYVR